MNECHVGGCRYPSAFTCNNPACTMHTCKQHKHVYNGVAICSECYWAFKKMESTLASSSISCTVCGISSEDVIKCNGCGLRHCQSHQVFLIKIVKPVANLAYTVGPEENYTYTEETSCPACAETLISKGEQIRDVLGNLIEQVDYRKSHAPPGTFNHSLFDKYRK